MKTLFSIGFLVFAAVIANFLIVILLNIAGLPGSILAGKPGIRSKRQFVVGSVVSALGQSFVYLAYTAFVVNWTALAVSVQKVSVGLWPVAFMAVVLPLWRNLIRARVENQENAYGNPQVEALHITLLIVLIGFFLFAFAPHAIQPVYGWVPYANPK